MRETIPVTDLYKRASDLYNDLTEEFKADDKNTKADYLKHSLLIVLRSFYTHFFLKFERSNVSVNCLTYQAVR